jgi:hypothetical protein
MPQKFILGAFIRPQTFEMATAVFDPERGKGNSVTVWNVARTTDLIATGSIDFGQFGGEWDVSAKLTGYPRSHATPGVSGAYQKLKGVEGGGGWGTPLYVAEATSAYLHEQFSLPYRSGTRGDLPGVSSEPDGRSASSSAWWRRALQAGLSQQESPCQGEEEEEEVEEEFELDGGDMPSRVDDAVMNAVSSANDEVNVSSVSYRIAGKWQGTRSGTIEKCIDIDVLTYDSCVNHGLVMFNTDATDRALVDLTFAAWDEALLSDIDEVHKDVLRVVNTGYLAALPLGRGAMTTLVSIARKHLTAPEVSAMIERFNEKVDAGGVRYEEAVVAVENPGRSRIRRVRIGRHTVLMRTNPRRMVIPRVIAHGRPVFYGPRPNPAGVSASLKKNLEALYQRRVAMGYGALADLP